MYVFVTVTSHLNLTLPYIIQVVSAVPVIVININTNDIGFRLVKVPILIISIINDYCCVPITTVIVIK